MAQETLWSCRTCMACVEICPVAVEHVPIIVQMRRKLVEDGAMDPLLTKTLQTIHKTGNSFGESKRKRGAWTKALPFAVKDARKEPVDVLWFVGDYASFDPRNQKVTQIFAALLHEAGVDFGILYDGESNAGNDVRRVGEEGLYEVLADANVKAPVERHVQQHRHHRPAFLQHHPQRISRLRRQVRDRALHDAASKRLFAERRLQVTKPLEVPRDLPRSLPPGPIQQGLRCAARAPRSCSAANSSRWDAARRIRSAAAPAAAESGFPIRSAPKSRRRIACKEAAAIPGLEVYVVSCPKDLTMFEDALKTTGNEGKFVVKELIELIREADCRRAAAAEVVGMKILVAVKQVAALDEDFEIRADGRDVESGFLDPRSERVGRFLARRRRSRSRRPRRQPRRSRRRVAWARGSR